MKSEILAALKTPLKVKERTGMGNRVYKYVATEDVVELMTEAFKGNWSTEILSSQMIDDQVLVSVRVRVFDDTKDVWFCQDSFASSIVQRYTSGQNAGKVTDVGNSYRSAVSKAIKAACERWGVALRMEDMEEDYSTPGHSYPAAPSAPAIPSPTPTPPPVVNVKPAPTSVPTAPVAPPVVNSPVTSSFGVITPPVSIPTPSAPQTFGPTPPSMPPGFGGPAAGNPTGFAKDTPPNNTGGFPPTEGPADGKITPIQKASLEYILSNSGKTLREVMAMAITDRNPATFPETMDNLPYEDAVTTIKFGNNAFRPSIS
jgi:hypothetical protein